MIFDYRDKYAEKLLMHIKYYIGMLSILVIKLFIRTSLTSGKITSKVMKVI